MAADEDATAGDTPHPTTEAEAEVASKEGHEKVDSKVTDEQWEAIDNILTLAYNHRMPDGHDPGKIFHKKVNRRLVPDYYDVIKEPIALSTIKARLAIHHYKEFSEFVRDFALIPHNAQVYNRPGAGAYYDALEIKKLFETELQKLVDSKVITSADAKLPYLGEIPDEEDGPATGEGNEEEEEEEEEEGEESDDSSGKGRKGKRSRKSVKREDSAEAAQVAEIDPRKRRGRPPRVDTPTEARIKNILKFMRRPKNPEGHQRIDHFERLPDKALMPEYYAEVKNPMAVDVLKKKLKRKKYNTAEQFMVDVELMLENAKSYNTEDSTIYKDAVVLQNETRDFAKLELERPDSDYASEDGRIPLPAGVEHNGETYKVGDWVHIQNPNDLQKPIPTQIYRTWKDVSGNQFINACWYYRPEQTVHRFDKHFFEHEVVKTGQYRDHSVDEIVDRCFIMFVTRFNKGRPRGFPANKEVYVCESRYNEEKHSFNKIKTWASCLPDEVRDKDYEMDLFPQPKRMKKKPSPIAYLVKDEQKEDDDLPAPTWGSDGAPPQIGAVHRRPRDTKDSPPPERTPTPPPKLPTPPPPPPRPTPIMTDTVPNGASRPHPNGYTPSVPVRQPSISTPTVPPQQRPTYQPNLSPAPAARTNPALTRGYSNSATPSYNSTSAPQSANYAPPARLNTSAAYASSSSHQNAYSAPQPIEAWHLPDAANALIPRDIAAQFQRDNDGRVLFFTSPPMDLVENNKNKKKSEKNLGHSAKYLAIRGEMEDERKRKRAERDAADAAEAEHVAQRAKMAAVQKQSEDAELANMALSIWAGELRKATQNEFRRVHGEEAWRREMEKALEGAVLP